MGGIDVNIIVNQAEETFPVVLAGLIANSFEIALENILILDNGLIPTHNDTIDHLLTELSNRCEKTVTFRKTELPGVASARQYLLEQSTSDYILSLDDDIFLYPNVIKDMMELIKDQDIGYVIGNVVEVSPFRDGLTFHPKTDNFEARNHYKDDLYHPAYVHGGCVLYDRKKLNNFGAYRLLEGLDPKKQAGEDVWVQTKIQENYGGLSKKTLRALHLIPKKFFRFEKDSIAGTAVEAGRLYGTVGRVLKGLSIADVSIEYFRRRDRGECISCE